MYKGAGIAREGGVFLVKEFVVEATELKVARMPALLAARPAGSFL